jgi:hypothetical protein
MDLINSRFVKPPFEKIEKSLAQFDFYPIQMKQLVQVQKIFAQSKILRKQHISVDFLIECLPNAGNIKAELLY